MKHLAELENRRRDLGETVARGECASALGHMAVAAHVVRRDIVGSANRQQLAHEEIPGRLRPADG